MAHRSLIAVALVGLLSVACTEAPQSDEMQADKTQETYLGKLEYQDQTLTKASAEFLHRADPPAARAPSW